MLDFRDRGPAKKANDDFSSRRKFLSFLMLVLMSILVVRAIYLQVITKDFLIHQGDMRQIDDVSVSAYRGVIVDREGEPLAISTPVESIWINPKELRFAKEEQLKVMEKLLSLPVGKVTDWIKEDPHRQFLYIARRVNPQLADRVKELKLTGVYTEREFKRYYPTGGVSGHLVGFTNVDDIGQAGMELGYEKMLKGTAGSKRVIRDGQRRIIEDIENIKEPISGKTLELSIDQRIQYLAYKELQIAVNDNKAKSGALVVLDAKNGEVLAAVNQPSFNPNTRNNLKESLYRNRGFTEVFEPGSTVKPFVVAAALDGGYITPNSIFVTNGTYAVGHNTVKDTHNYGTMDTTRVITKSSNIGETMMSLKMPPKYLYDIYHQLGFGVSAGLGFPGEATGVMKDYKKWHDFDRATMSFGYGLNASALQLARAYTALADDGVLHSVSLIKREEDDDTVRVFSAKTAKTVRKMMETVLTKDGTAIEAVVPGYSAAGKTGTAKKATAHGYTEKSYFAVFAGMAPVENPRLIIAVMIDEPSAGKYYGGLVAAPVFSRVMAGALRILEIAPDKEETMPVLLTQRQQ